MVIRPGKKEECFCKTALTTIQHVQHARHQYVKDQLKHLLTGSCRRFCFLSLEDFCYVNSLPQILCCISFMRLKWLKKLKWETRQWFQHVQYAGTALRLYCKYCFIHDHFSQKFLFALNVFGGYGSVLHTCPWRCIKGGA